MYGRDDRTVIMDGSFRKFTDALFHDLVAGRPNGDHLMLKRRLTTDESKGRSQPRMDIDSREN